MKSCLLKFSLALSILLVAACSGPAPAPQPQAKNSEATESNSNTVRETDRKAAAVREPKAAETPRPEQTHRQAASAPAKPRVAAKETPSPARSGSAAPAPVQNGNPSSTTAANSAPVITLPGVTAPPIDPPGNPPEPKSQPAPVPPPPHSVTVPSGTLISIRMIDSVDSGTSHEGETFKASLDAPVVVNNETVFPRGSEAYVKVAKVQKAGNLSGRSELQVQLDRIFLGGQSYRIESNKFVNTGASQGAKTARSAGIGAALGAAIGAIAGGGKGAAIGAATGAGAGVGVEAITKGEQVRIDSETRLDFRLEDSLDVTVQFPSPNSSQPRNSPSGLPRFGTRQ